MEEKVPTGTKILLDRSAIPVNRYKPYGSTDSISPTIEAVIEAAVDWGNGEYRYRIKIGTSKTIFPIARNKFEIIETQSNNK